MCLCFETIKIVDGVCENISFHQSRFNKTREKLFSSNQKIDLKNAIKAPLKGVYRAKVVYGNEIENIEIRAYEPRREFSRFLLKKADFEYAYKFLDRRALEERYEGFDEVVFVKDELLTDTSIANIALLIDGVWKTPKSPLLKGTMRAKLLSDGMLQEENLSKSDIKIAQKFAIMNALMGFKILDNITIEEEN
jgi:4-amino-4-deoxychorismate lyase